MRRFPILSTDRRKCGLEWIPWDMLSPHAAQATRNHGQTLERLAQRGGLGVSEAIAILQDQPWQHIPLDVAAAQLRLWIGQWALRDTEAN